MSQNSIPDPDISSAKPPIWRRFSVVWLVPIAALLIALAIAWKDYSGRGPLIEITFDTANGIRPGETTIKFRDVTVGTVEALRFTPDLDRVIASARMEPEVAPYLDSDAQFWVVQPEISLRGISGLDTVLSGAYIEAVWDAVAGTAVANFEGLSEAPLVQTTDRGLWLLLTSEDGQQIAAGAPVSFRGVTVGHLEAPRLDASGAGVVVRAFIESPHDALITSTTRFWDSSGFSVSLGTNGITLDMSSLAALVEGGVSFETAVSGGEAVTPGASFRIFEDADAARQDALAGDTGAAAQPVSVLFDDVIDGLTIGADVRFKGLSVGTVTALTPLAQSGGGETSVAMLATLALRPDRLGVADEGLEAFLAAYVENGLRAQMRGTGLLSDTIVVALVEAPDAPASDAGNLPYPAIPALPPVAGDLGNAAAGVLARVEALPVEELMQAAIDLLDSLDALAASGDTQALPAAARAILAETEALISSEAVKNIPVAADDTLSRLRDILDQFEAAEGAARLVAAIAAAETAAGRIAEASAPLPAITADLAKLSSEAAALPLASLSARADALLASIDEIMDQDSSRALPGELNASLETLRGVLEEFDAGETAKNVSSAAQAVADAASALPALINRLDALARQVETTVSDYGEEARFNAEAVAMMRDIREAAGSIEQLAKMLQRNPSAILTGR